MLSRLMLMDERLAALLITTVLAVCAAICNVIIWSLTNKPLRLFTLLNPMGIAFIVAYPPFLGVFRIAKENRAIRLAYRSETRRSMTNFVTNAEFRRASSLEFGRAQMLHKPLSILAIAIVDFKQKQDVWGEQPARDIQQELALRISGELSEYDFFCLYSDFFLIVLPGCDQTASARVCQRIQQRVAATPFGMEFAEVKIEICSGSTSRQQLAASDSLSSMIGETACQISHTAAEGTSIEEIPQSSEQDPFMAVNNLDELIEQVND